MYFIDVPWTVPFSARGTSYTAHYFIFLVLKRFVSGNKKKKGYILDFGLLI